MIRLLGLEEYLNKKIDQLSRGQKQRVALARTMVIKPKILLLDEPLSALDGVIKESIKDGIKTIAKEYHLTTIIVTHDPEEIIGSSENNFVKNFILNQLEIKRNNIFFHQLVSVNPMVWKFYGFSSEQEYRRQVPTPFLMVLKKDKPRVQKMIDNLVLGGGREEKEPGAGRGLKCAGSR